MKRILSIVVVLALLAGGGVLFMRWKAESAKPVATFTTTPASTGHIVARVTATGTLSALVTVQVGSQVSGRISDIKVDFNSTVKKGQVLARLDPQIFQAAVEQANANYVAAQGNLQKAKVQALDAQRQYERSKQLMEKKLIAQAELDTAQAGFESAQAQIDVAKGQVEQSRAQLNQARLNLGYTTIYSPIDGVVISRSVDVGQTVAASLQAPTLFVIAEDLRKMHVDTNVAEADVGKLEPGMKTSFTVDAYPQEIFRGTVRQIRNAPQTVQNVVTYDAVIDVENPELKLKPGMTANVTFVYADRDNVLRVPNAALRFRPDPAVLAQLRGDDPAAKGKWKGRGAGGAGPSNADGAAKLEGVAQNAAVRPPSERRVWVLKGEIPHPVTVTTGISDGSFTEIVSGELHEGDAVVTELASDSTKPGGAPGGGGQRPAGGGMGGRGMGRMF